MTCYVCNSSAACIDHYSPDPAHEVDCGTSEYDDGFCSKLKDITRVSGIRVTAGRLGNAPVLLDLGGKSESCVHSLFKWIQPQKEKSVLFHVCEM